MPLIVKDRVQQTSSTTGTGTLTLGGTVSGFQTFSSAIGNGNTTYYAIVNDAEWEVGLGTVSAGALSRDTVLESSNAGSLVNFSAGTKAVFCTYPAEKSVIQDETGNVGINIASPAYKLDVAGTSRVYSASGASPISYWWSGGGYRLAINMTDGASGLAIYNTLDGNAHTWQTASTERMRLHASGGVSIGNTTDAGAGNLSVTGRATIQTLTVGLGGGNVSTNTAVGASAMAATATGALNTALGQVALTALTSGQNNTALGRGALFSTTTASDNTAVGLSALFNNNGAFNTAVGTLSLTNNTTSANNTAIGYGSLQFNTLGGGNVANGYYALRFNTIVSNLTAIGAQALQSNTTNVATLGTITGGTGYTNGTYTGVVMTLSSGSTATTYPTATIVVAGGAVTTVTITSAGVAFKDTTTVLTAPAASIGGTGSGFSVPVATLASGSNNTAVGYQSLFGNTTGINNTALGSGTLRANTTGQYNVAIGGPDSAGFEALRSNTTASFNLAIAPGALARNTTGASNTAVGYQVLYNNLTGQGNVGVGGSTSGLVSAALNANTAGNYNTAMGAGALKDTTVSDNTALGWSAGASISTGAQNTIVGRSAGNSGSNNLTTGSNNTFIGYLTAASSASDSNSIVIGANTTGNGSNTTTIGNTSTTLTRVFGVIQSTTYTVASLPSATTSGVGARAFVTDALAPTFGATVMTGGAVATPVYSDGTNWKVG